MKNFRILLSALILTGSSMAIANPSLENLEAYGPLDDAMTATRWECVSRNARGHRFYGVDRFRSDARRKSLNKCLRNSRYCDLISCYVR